MQKKPGLRVRRALSVYTFSTPTLRPLRALSMPSSRSFEPYYAPDTPQIRPEYALNTA